MLANFILRKYRLKIKLQESDSLKQFTHILPLLMYWIMKARHFLYGVAIVVAALTVFQLVTIGLNYPVIMVVTGQSMLPTLNPYDVIILEQFGKKGVQKGDIVVVDYRDKNNLFSNYDYIVHRVTKIWDKDGISYMQTKGDNAENPEYAAESSRALARVFTSIPYLGVVLWPPANFVIIGSALFVFVYFRR